MLIINALAALDSVIIPVQTLYLPLKGMTQLIKTMGKVQRQINQRFKIDGELLTLADMRTNFLQATATSIIIKVYQTVIPVAIKAAETSASGKSIYSYDKYNAATKVYDNFTREVVDDGEKQRNKHEASRTQ